MSKHRIIIITPPSIHFKVPFIKFTPMKSARYSCFVFAFGLLATLMLPGCTSTFIAPLQRPHLPNLEVYTTKIPDRDYIELAYIQVDGSLFTRPEKLMSRITERAVLIGADAVIRIRYDFQGHLPIISGTAIRYTGQ